LKDIVAGARARGRKGGRPKGLSGEAKKTAMAAETIVRYSIYQ